MITLTRRSLTWTLTFLLVGLAAWTALRSSSVQPVVDGGAVTRQRSGPNNQLPEFPARAPGHMSAGGALGTSPISCGFSSDFFTITAEALAGNAQVRIDATETNPRTSEFEEWHMTEAVTNGAVEQMAMRHGSEWYLALRGAAGGLEVERWDLARTTGAYYAGLRPATAGIGQPTATAPLVVSIHEGQFLSASQRPRPAITRTRLVSFASLAHVESMVVDPDARYLVLEVDSTTARQLVQVALIASTSPPISVGSAAVLMDFASIPDLSTTFAIGQLVHPDHGRALTVEGDGGVACLWDQENDGVFEGREDFTGVREWLEKYPYQVWINSY